MAAATDNRRARLTLPPDEQILIEREFDAPRHLVYRAFTEPELVELGYSIAISLGQQHWLATHGVVERS